MHLCISSTVKFGFLEGKICFGHCLNTPESNVMVYTRGIKLDKNKCHR